MNSVRVHLWRRPRLNTVQFWPTEFHIHAGICISEQLWYLWLLKAIWLTLSRTCIYMLLSNQRIEKKQRFKWLWYINTGLKSLEGHINSKRLVLPNIHTLYRFKRIKICKLCPTNNQQSIERLLFMQNLIIQYLKVIS